MLGVQLPRRDGLGRHVGGGLDEVQDVRAAIGRVREEAPGPTVVCGWSFGANVALREAVDDERVAALVLIGVPLEPRRRDAPRDPTTGGAPGAPHGRCCSSRASATSTARPMRR